MHRKKTTQKHTHVSVCVYMYICVDTSIHTQGFFLSVLKLKWYNVLFVHFHDKLQNEEQGFEIYILKN